MMKWVITGLDGSGKDTQISNLINYGVQKNKKVISYSIWDALKLFADTNQVELKKILDVFLTQMAPQARSLFLQSVLMQSEKQIDFLAYDLVIFNAGTIKYAASEHVLGCPLSLWFSVETHFKFADKVIYLKCTPETVKQRKTELSSYEKLFWDKLDSYNETLEHYISQIENVTLIDGDLDSPRVFEQIRVKTQLFRDEK
jgi:thymidylate kinase